MIDCVTKDETKDSYARIVAVGGPNLPGVSPPDSSELASRLRRRGLHITESARWTLTIDEAIDGILAGKWTFYIHVGAYDRVSVQVATSPSGLRYLKTELDQDTPDELLFLPQCR
jgi:hypothetical protein